MDLAHVRRGNGPPVIVLQQLDPPAFWARTVERLAGSHEVVAVDLPGFNDSPPLPGDQAPTVPAIAAATAGWIATQGLREAYVVGSSLGGAISIELAKLSAVAGTVAFCPVGLWTAKEATRALRTLAVGGAVARALAARPGPMTRTRLGRTLAFGQIVARPSRMPEPMARAALRGMAAAPGFAATRREVAGYRLEGPDPDVPVTIGWGDRDRLTPPRQAARAATVLPSARIVWLRGCGHAPMVDDPALTARVVLDAMGR